MTPVSQTKLYAKDAIHNGNCFAACLASLLDLPLWMVPPFEDMFGRSDWAFRVEDWLQRMFRFDWVRTEGHAPESLPEFYIGSGLSPRGVRHSVIYRRIASIPGYPEPFIGEMVHDPHPSGAGIVAIEWTWHLVPMEPQ